MRIVHFSDSHFGRPSFAPASLFDKRLLGTFNFLVRRKGELDERAVSRLYERMAELAPDIIVCSGDITCVGEPAEFAAALDAFRPFKALADTSFFYTPGNHDAYVSNSRCVGAMAAACRFLNPPGCDLPGDGFFDCSIQGVDVALIHLAHPTNIFLSSGTLAPAVKVKLDTWCAGDKSRPRVLVGHFPTRRADGAPLGRRRHLKGGQAISSHLAAGTVDLYLCGHIHSPFTRSFASGSLECCAGSLTMKHVYSIVDIDSTGKMTQRYENT
ncbi:MAG: metallophosphoesterase [Lentisphaeria bacterium]|nr:metallophosphoesterase [Lentisphaeria bacterium]